MPGVRSASLPASLPPLCGRGAGYFALGVFRACGLPLRLDGAFCPRPRSRARMHGARGAGFFALGVSLGPGGAGLDACGGPAWRAPGPEAKGNAYGERHHLPGSALSVDSGCLGSLLGQGHLVWNRADLEQERLSDRISRVRAEDGALRSRR